MSMIFSPPANKNMDRFYRVKLEDDEAVDYTASSRMEEVPALDLTCKKHSLTSEDQSSLSSDSNSDHPQDLHENEMKDLGKSPASAKYHSDGSVYEGTSDMVTPPPDPDMLPQHRYEDAFRFFQTPREEFLRHYAMSCLNTPPAQLPSSLTPAEFLSTIPMAAPVTSTIKPIPTNNNNYLMDPSEKSSSSYPQQLPTDLLSISMTTDSLFNQNSNKEFLEYRKKIFESHKRTKKGTNINMRRTSVKSPGLPTSTMDEKDAAYWEKRRKNNEAAKRSRDSRRAKEMEITIRAEFLERENLKLKYEIFALQREHAKLQCMTYGK